MNCSWTNWCSSLGVLFLLNYLAVARGSSNAWPAGQYGLPMPVSGCPHANFTWQTGWRYEDTEDKTPSNGRSKSLHIEGVVGFSSVNKSFCIKTDKSQDSSLRATWPKGKYCIYKKGNGYCPQGLQAGLVTWDDEDSENQNSQSGILPEGYYAGSRTTIQYCCSIDGLKTTPIRLPIEKPFYLLAYSSIKCQQVEWALATLEWIRYDTENGVNNDGKNGDYPYGAEGGVNGHTIHYCYYTSCKHILNATSGIFQSPNFPYGYPDGQLCSWMITVPSNYIIRLQFTNFSLTHNLGPDGDVVQIYDGFDDNAAFLGGYHGVRQPSDVISSSNALYVVFRSDAAWNAKGFRAHYDAIDPKESQSTTTSFSHPETTSFSHPEMTTSPAFKTTTTRPTGSTSAAIKSPAPKIACAKKPSPSVHVASVVVPVFCLIGCILIAGAMLYRWRKMHSREKNMSVMYQAKTASNPSYFGTKILNNKQRNKKEDEVSIAFKEEEIYQEVSEKRIDNPLYESQDNLDTGNPLYQSQMNDPLVKSQDNMDTGNPLYQSQMNDPLVNSQDNLDTGNPLYQSPPDSNGSNMLYDSIPYNSGFDEN